MLGVILGVGTETHLSALHPALTKLLPKRQQAQTATLRRIVDFSMLLDQRSIGFRKWFSVKEIED